MDIFKGSVMLGNLSYFVDFLKLKDRDFPLKSVIGGGSNMKIQDKRYFRK